MYTLAVASYCSALGLRRRTDACLPESEAGDAGSSWLSESVLTAGTVAAAGASVAAGAASSAAGASASVAVTSAAATVAASAAFFLPY